MKNMKLGTKIAFGFGMLIAITAVLGVIGILKMSNVATDNVKLAEELVPELEIAVDLRAAANRMMYAMRGYGFTEEKRFYDQARKELQIVTEHLEEGRVHAMKAVHLEKLGAELANAAKAVEDYKILVRQTEETYATISANRKVLDVSAIKAMRSTGDFLRGQNEKFKKDLAERQEKIRFVTRLVESGSEARVTNFKSQSLNNSILMEEAINKLGETAGMLERLRKITRDKDDIKMIDDIEAAAKNYRKAMRAFLSERKKGESANASTLLDYREIMDKNAGIYVKNCDAFLGGQQKKLTADMLERNAKITLVNDIIDLINETRIGSFKAQAFGDSAIMKSALTNFPKIAGKFEALKKITRLSVDIKRIDEVEAASNNYKKGMITLLANWMPDLDNRRSDVGKEFIKACKVITDNGLKTTHKIANDVKTAMGTASMVMIIGLIAAVIFGVSVAVFISRGMRKTLDRNIGEINTASEELKTAVQQQLTSTTEQAAATTQISTTMKEMAVSSGRVLERTSGVVSSADDTNNFAKDGKLSLEVAIEAIETVRGQVEDVVQNMLSLNEKNQQMGMVLEIINELSEQTTILSYNATIEAAGAGEAGRRFSALAEQIMRLANKAVDSSKDVKTLLEDVQRSANKTVLITEDGMKSVEEGRRRILDSKRHFDDIFSSAEETLVSAKEIEITINQQTSTTEQTTQGVEGIRMAAEEVKISSKQTLRTAEQLLDMAKKLALI